MKRGPVKLIVCATAALLSQTVGGAAQIVLQLPKGPEYTDIELGEREAGKSYPLVLGAQNRNCPQPLDFRFTSKTLWLKMPADPVARQVPTGQTRDIQATIDLTNAALGRQQGFLDVDCENCGFFVFKNCKIDKQQLRLNLNVVAAPAGGQPPQVAQGQGGQAQQGQAPVGQQQGGQPQDVRLPPLIDYDDKRIPKRLRDKAKAAYEAWQAALAKLKECETKLARLRAAAAQADADADKARRAAETAEQDARNARAQEEAAKEERKQAAKEAGEALTALEEAENAKKLADRSGTPKEKQEAQAELEKAQAAKAAADKRLSDAYKAVGLYSAKDLDEMDKDAKKKKKASADAAAAANAAAAAVSKKEKEFAHHEQEAKDAEAAKDNAEKEAKDAIPAPSAGPTPDEIAQARKAANDCVKELGELISAQAKAMQAMAALGALKEGNTYDSDLADWAKAVDAANDLFDKLPPGTEYVGEIGEIVSGYVGTAQQVLTTIRAAIGVWSGVKYTGQLNLAPKAGVTKSPEDTKDYLKDSGLAGSDKEAAAILKQMEKYSETNSTKGFEQELADKRAKCDAMVKAAEDMEKAAGGK